MDYPRLKDALRLRLHRVREFLKEQVRGRCLEFELVDE